MPACAPYSHVRTVEQGCGVKLGGLDRRHRVAVEVVNLAANCRPDRSALRRRRIRRRPACTQPGRAADPVMDQRSPPRGGVMVGQLRTANRCVRDVPPRADLRAMRAPRASVRHRCLQGSFSGHPLMPLVARGGGSTNRLTARAVARCREPCARWRDSDRNEVRGAVAYGRFTRCTLAVLPGGSTAGRRPVRRARHGTACPGRRRSRRCTRPSGSRTRRDAAAGGGRFGRFGSGDRGVVRAGWRRQQLRDPGGATGLRLKGSSSGMEGTR